MQPRPEDAMEEVEAEAVPKVAVGLELGFWLAARWRLTPDGPFCATARRLHSSRHQLHASTSSPATSMKRSPPIPSET